LAERGDRLRSRSRSRAARGAASESSPPNAAVRLASLSQATSTNGARTSSKGRGCSASRKAICAGHASSVPSRRSGGARRSASARSSDHSGNAVPSRRRTRPRMGRTASGSRPSQANRCRNRSRSPLPKAQDHASSRASTKPVSSPSAETKSPPRRSSSVLARSTIPARSCSHIERLRFANAALLISRAQSKPGSVIVYLVAAPPAHVRVSVGLQKEFESSSNKHWPSSPLGGWSRR
jgi:hypothetical protein